VNAERSSSVAEVAVVYKMGTISRWVQLGHLEVQAFSGDRFGYAGEVAGTQFVKEPW
jgi:hypothetical protein